MTTTAAPTFERPAADEHAPYYARYIDLVPDVDLLDYLQRQMEGTAAFFRAIRPALHGHRYAEGKWSIREMVGHVADTERIFAYRALRFARADQTPLAGFDENAYVPAANADARDLDSLWTRAARPPRGTGVAARLDATAAPPRQGERPGDHVRALDGGWPARRPPRGDPARRSGRELTAMRANAAVGGALLAPPLCLLTTRAGPGARPEPAAEGCERCGRWMGASRTQRSRPWSRCRVVPARGELALAADPARHALGRPRGDLAVSRGADRRGAVPHGPALPLVLPRRRRGRDDPDHHRGPPERRFGSLAADRAPLRAAGGPRLVPDLRGVAARGRALGDLGARRRGQVRPRGRRRRAGSSAGRGKRPAPLAAAAEGGPLLGVGGRREILWLDGGPRIALRPPAHLGNGDVTRIGWVEGVAGLRRAGTRRPPPEVIYVAPTTRVPSAVSNGHNYFCQRAMTQPRVPTRTSTSWGIRARGPAPRGLHRQPRGAVIVKDRHIVSTGYNGTPSNMPNCSAGGCHRCAHRDQYRRAPATNCASACTPSRTRCLPRRVSASRWREHVCTPHAPLLRLHQGALQATCDRRLLPERLVATPIRTNQGEYERLQSRFTGGIRHLSVDDPDSAWAITSRRAEAGRPGRNRARLIHRKEEHVKARCRVRRAGRITLPKRCRKKLVGGGPGTICGLGSMATA